MIENAPFYGGDKAYWVRKNGRIPHKDILRHDVDEALANTIKPFDFELYLRLLGYQFVRKSDKFTGNSRRIKRIDSPAV